MATNARAVTAPPSKRASLSTEIVKPGTAPSPDRSALQAALPLVIPESETEAPKIEINGPHVVTFGWGDHGRTGITMDTYKKIGLTPRPCFLTLQEQIKMEQEAAINKHKKRRKKTDADAEAVPDWSSIPLPILQLLSDKTKGKACEVACGDRHTLMMTNKGQVWAFGDSALGALGLGGTNDWEDPEAGKELKPKMARRYIKRPPKSTRTVKHHNPDPKVVDLKAVGCEFVVHIYAGGYSSYALSGKGQIYAWGENTHGQLGVFNDEEHAADIEKEKEDERKKKPMWQMAKTPEEEAREKAEQEEKDRLEAETLKALEDEQKRLEEERKNDVQVNPLRQLSTVRIPRLVRKLKKILIKQLACGRRHVVALAKGAGAIYSWGYNNCGQLGMLDTNDRRLPCRVETLRGMVVIELAAGRHYTVAVGTTDSPNFLGNKLSRKTKKAREKLRLVVGWGENTNGQLALGHYDSPVLTPATSLALASWGKKDGGPTKPKKIHSATCGAFHTLFKDEQGRLLSSGNNRFGQLGHGDLYDRCFPIFIDSIASISVMACGDRWSIAGTSNGLIYTWGSNTYGELGTGDKSCYLQPEILSTLKEVRPLWVSAGNRHNAIIVTDKEDDSKPAFRRANTHETITISEDRRTATRTVEENEFVHSGICLPSVSEGKYRWDVSIGAMSSDSVPTVVGCCFENADLSADPTYVINAWTYNSTGEKCFCDTGPEEYGEPYYEGDIVGVEIDRDIGYVRFYRNNVQQGIAYYVNFEQDDRDLFLYVGMPGENDTATLLVTEDDNVDEDEDEEEVLICLNEEEDEAKRRAPLQVFFECASCKVMICRSCAYQCHGGHAVGLKIQHGFRMCDCSKSRPQDHQCISLPEVDSDEEGGGGGRRARRHKKAGSKKVKKYSSLATPAKYSFLDLLHGEPEDAGMQVKK